MTMTADNVQTDHLLVVEFLGLPSPLAYPEIQKALARPIKTRQDREEVKGLRAEIDKQESRRQLEGFARFTGHSTLHLGVQHGLSRNYTWGPHKWTVEMSPADVEILMKMEPRHPMAFRVHPAVLVVGRI